MTDAGARGPTFRDWALLAVGLGFVAMGLVLLRRAPDKAIVTIAFFGACTVVFASTIIRKRRHRRLRPLRAEIAGGVPIRPKRGRAVLLGGGVALLGAVLVVFGRGYGPLFWALGWFVAAVGAVVLAGVATGRLPVGFIQFDPAGFTLGHRRCTFTVPWDRVAQLSAAEFHDNPVLLVWIDDPGALVAATPDQRVRALGVVASNERWLGAHVMIMTEQYGLDLPLLVTAMQRYVADPASRAELSASRRPLALGDAADS